MNPDNLEGDRMSETKAEKFARVVPKRVDQALHRIRLIGHCANRSNYEFTPEQVEKMIKALSVAVVELSNKFNSRKRTEPGFGF